LNENVLLDLDTNGNIVAMTIEHAKNMTNVLNFSFQQINEKYDKIKELVIA